MTAAELAAELAHASLLRRPVLLTGDALALALRLARDEVEREADIEALAEQTRAARSGTGRGSNHDS